jgi:glycosyltransferase involved in cell wall biosynthesis
MEHVPFNASLLKIILSAFPNDLVCFYAEESHLEHVQDQIGKELAASVICKKLILPSRHSSFYLRLFSDFKLVKFLLGQLNENPQKDVLVITGMASILWALKYYTGTIHKDKRVQVIIHGDFSTLHRTPRKSILNPFYYIGSLKTALKLAGHEKVQYIVLEEAIRDAIIGYLPVLRNRVSVIDHPVPSDSQDVETKDLDSPIRFGFLGRASEKKGFSKYLTVASEISKEFPGQVKFHFIGWISDGQRREHHSKMAFLNEKPRTERMNRNEYVEGLKNLHFICLFFDEYYECCASGVLMDSIAWGKPIIATELPIFKMLQYRFGDVGYLCSDNEFSELISSIISKNDSVRYRRQVENMKRAKIARMPETVAMKYIELVNNE